MHELTFARVTFLFVTAMLGGALNSVAGGGSFLTLPALIFVGARPVLANTTNTIALWPAALASTIAYRREFRAPRAFLYVLGAVSIAGGLLGALLLLSTSDTTFLRLLPWLLLAATLLFTFGGRLTARLRGGDTFGGHKMLIVGALVQLVIATYGGYFGGGMGIMMLATLSIMGMTNIHEMNGLKSLLGTIINGIGVVAFALANAVAWKHGLVMVVGATLGGYLGATLARRIDPKWVRLFVMAVGWGMTVYFFTKAYVGV